MSKNNKKDPVSKKSRNMRIVYKKEENGQTSVHINNELVGYSVPKNYKWTVKPSFPYLREDEYITNLEFDGPIEAARELVKMWERYSDARDLWEEEDDYDNWTNGAFINY